MQNKPFLKTFQARHPRSRECRLPPVPRSVAVLSARLAAEAIFAKPAAKPEPEARS